ncbi:SDR family NAD(P)-dependent oxidoreductase [Frigoribacterium sp. PhB24]|uniref:SDR family NAD(P)-dependent oxidoreductase n=1 Tax=Frigoribacterium sp. PhB24 TaxID=2485204 RepID=UPI001F344F08|nr:SDR family NAD(P)-dependent oxidoreductase [Frigoribacterium sp. PhB24]
MSGASTGMGAATARELARRGFHVLAGVRRPADGDALRADGIEPVILDITEPGHVEALVERITSDPDARPLRALVNNAGVSVYAPVEAYPLEEWRGLFEVNLFGHVAMIQALLPTLIAGGGRIVNISSVGGKGAMPTYGPYAATKFALEAVSDALRRELSRHGVQVVVVEPGAVRSQMADRGATATSAFAAQMRPDLQRRYGDLITAALAQTSAHIGRGLSADAAGSIIADAATIRRPRTRYTVGRDASMLVALTRVLPDRLLDRVIAAGLRPHLPVHATTPTAVGSA